MFQTKGFSSDCPVEQHPMNRLFVLSVLIALLVGLLPLLGHIIRQSFALLLRNLVQLVT